MLKPIENHKMAVRLNWLKPRANPSTTPIAARTTGAPRPGAHCVATRRSLVSSTRRIRMAADGKSHRRAGGRFIL